MGETDVQDKRLIHEIKKGNVKVFEIFFLKYYPRFSSFILGLVKDKWIAEDIAQNVFMKVWIHRDSLQEEQSLQAYLYVLSKHEIYNHFRAKCNRVVDYYIEGMHDCIIQEPEVENELYLKELQHSIYTAIESMPEKRREVFKMSRYGHRSSKEIAKITNLSIRTVEKHIELALRDLRIKLGAVFCCLIAVMSGLSAQNFKEVQRFKAPYASQAVAVDDQYFYAIDNNHITKYTLEGDSVTTWHEPNKERVRHINSGIVIDGKLYCAHSNFPEIPMASSIEIFDTQTLKPIQTISLGIDVGSCTWVLSGKDCWYVFFAHYERNGGQPGCDVSWSQLVQYDLQWKRTQAWILPKELIQEIKPTSLSGAVIIDQVFYCTGHDAQKCYLLALPPYGMRLEWIDTISIPFCGQGIAIDALGNLWGIDRKNRYVIKSSMVEN